MTIIPKISPFLWFNDNAEDAMNFYTSVFKGGKVTSLRRHGDTVMGVALKLHMAPARTNGSTARSRRWS